MSNRDPDDIIFRWIVAGRTAKDDLADLRLGYFFRPPFGQAIQKVRQHGLHAGRSRNGLARLQTFNRSALSRAEF
jgi:hypothetical protein